MHTHTHTFSLTHTHTHRENDTHAHRTYEEVARVTYACTPCVRAYTARNASGIISRVPQHCEHARHTCCATTRRLMASWLHSALILHQRNPLLLFFRFGPGFEPMQQITS